ncbi:hypothetical protein PV08_01489 [Exophiala spinifera]|uniref:Aquaporin n=1 Tax=Exophiala spinifera TaxID=91928 RepID=A0A0D2BR38_9EURO|nr:uncharacterized protein PV08_01489 [Exophiala spinifera]KIW20910.1 hypothetical protein PV08_01489 [Exophiala spinifera]
MPRSWTPTSLQGHSALRSRDGARDYPFAGEEQARREESKRRRARQHFVAALGEFVGTVLFLWFSFAIGQTAASTGDVAGTSSQIVLTSLGFGFSLLVNVWVFYRISGGLFNPAVTLGMVITGNLPWLRGLLLLPAQLLGGMVAAALVKCMFPPKDLAFNTLLMNGTTPAQGVFIEMFLTALLVFTVLMLAAEKQRSTFVAPVGIGLALFVAMMAGIRWTGASLNPARSLGPAVATPHFPGYHYIYWFGPIMGALVAGGYYRFVKWLHYEDANPGQDAIDEREKEKEEETTQS